MKLVQPLNGSHRLIDRLGAPFGGTLPERLMDDLDLTPQKIPVYKVSQLIQTHTLPTQGFVRQPPPVIYQALSVGFDRVGC